MHFQGLKPSKEIRLPAKCWKHVKTIFRAFKLAVGVMWQSVLTLQVLRAQDQLPFSEEVFSNAKLTPARQNIDETVADKI
jgi:hypothetical protein